MPSGILIKGGVVYERIRYTKRYINLIDYALSKKEKARLLAVSSENATDFLYDMLISSLGLKLADPTL